MVNLDEIISDIYGNGRFNAILIVLCSTACFMMAVELQASLFLLHEPEFNCTDNIGFKDFKWLDKYSYENYTKDILNFNGTIRVATKEQCWGIGINESIGAYQTYSCSHWNYSKAIMESNYVSKFNLVCDNKGYVPWINCVFLISIAAGFSFSTVIDRLGRKRMYFVLCTWQILAQLGYAFVWNLPSLFILSALRGFPCSINYLGLSMNLELLPIKKRSKFANLFWTSWPIGYMISPGIAYLIRNEMYLRLSMIAPTVFYIPLYFITMESPRWLVLKDRTDEAVKNMKWLAKANSAKLPAKYFDNLKDKLENTHMRTCKHKEYNESLRNILHSRTLLTHMFMFCILNTAIAFAYMGLTLSSKFVSDNIYLNMVLQGFVEMPAILISWITAEYLGRRISTLLIVSMSSICVALTPFLSEGILRMIVAALGKLTLTSAYCIIDFYILELVPTSIRNGCFFTSVTITGFITAFSPIFNAYSKGYYNYVFYACATLASSVVAYIFLPETKDRILPQTIEELETMFSRRNKGKTDNSATNSHFKEVEPSLNDIELKF